MAGFLINTHQTDSDFRENPFQTKIGQEVVSVQESFEARLFREGRPQNGYSKVACTSGVLASCAMTKASPGCIFYPLSVMVSCDQDAQVYIVYSTNMQNSGVNGNGIIYEYAFVKAGTPLIVRPAGGVRILEGGNVQVQCVPNANGNLYGSVYGVEVTSNA